MHILIVYCNFNQNLFIFSVSVCALLPILILKISVVFVLINIEETIVFGAIKHIISFNGIIKRTY